jgi:hopanoid biosynthesis associated RND transporter like protein HpnN
MQPGRGDRRQGFELSEWLRSVTETAAARPTFTLVVAFLSSVICVVGTLLFMEFKTDRSDLIDPSADFHRRWNSYAQEFGDRSDLVVVVQANDPDQIKHTLEELGGRLRQETDRFSHILFKVEPGDIRRKGLQYLSPTQLEDGLKRLETFRPVLNGKWERVKLDSLTASLVFQLKDRLQERDEKDKQRASAERYQTTLTQIALLATSLESFIKRDDFRNPWLEIVSIDPSRRNEGREVIYLMNETGTVGFLKARPIQASKSFDGATPSIDRMRELIAESLARHRSSDNSDKTLRIGLTGIPVLENDEMRRSQADMITASILSFVGVGILLLVGFRGWRHPMLALVMLAIAMCWSFGYTTLVIGHLNILSVSFAAILIGLGIDFAIHYLAKYLELRHQAFDLKPALLASSASVGVGIVTAALTTSLAFLCASLTDFLGVAELGIIAGGGVLLCAAATFLVLPALVAVADGGTEPQRLPTPFEGTGLRNIVSRFPKRVALFSALIVTVVAWHAFELDESGAVRIQVGYDYNLLNLQAQGLESVEIQKTVFHDADRQQRPGQGSLLFAVSIADSAQHARELKEKFAALDTVHHVEELGSRLPEFPASSTQLLVQGFQAHLAHLPTQLPAVEPVAPRSVGSSLEELHELLLPINNPIAIRAARSIDQFLDALDRLETAQQVQRLTEFQGRLMGSLLAQFRSLSEAADPTPLSLDDLPSELTSRFVSRSGKWLVQIYPKDPIWDIAPLEEFVADVRSIDPEVTGTPLQNFEASGQIMRSYQNAAIYALAAVSLVLIIDLLGRSLAMFVVLPSAVIVACVGVAQVSMQIGRAHV